MKKFFAVAALSFVLGAAWHRWHLPPFGMGLADGTQPAPHKWGYDPANHNVGESQRLNALQKVYARRSARIVMFGDSNTQFVNWQELLDRDDVANRGLSADVAATALRRIESLVALKPEIVFILLGTNDLLFRIPADETVVAYRKILQVLASHGIRAVVQSVPPTRLLNDGQRDEVNAAASVLNARLKALAQESGVTFVDLGEPELVDDGVHFSAAGYAAWAKALGPYLPK